MVNPTYLINIYYQNSVVNGQQLVNIGGTTQSVPSYSSSYFIASMPEVLLYATGSSYTNALSNLLIMASASPDPTNPPLSDKRTW